MKLLPLTVVFFHRRGIVADLSSTRFLAFSQLRYTTNCTYFASYSRSAVVVANVRNEIFKNRYARVFPKIKTEKKRSKAFENIVQEIKYD